MIHSPWKTWNIKVKMYGDGTWVKYMSSQAGALRVVESWDGVLLLVIIDQDCRKWSPEKEWEPWVSYYGFTMSGQ